MSGPDQHAEGRLGRIIEVAQDSRFSDEFLGNVVRSNMAGLVSLRETLARQQEALRNVEWGGSRVKSMGPFPGEYQTAVCCPSCHGDIPRHRKDCELAEVLSSGVVGPVEHQ